MTVARRAVFWPGFFGDMELPIAEQAGAFVGAVCLGFFVGIFYDLLRLFRQRLRWPGLAYVLDLVFWIVVVVSIFLFAIRATGGKVRIYVLLSIFGGATAYFLSFSAWIMGLGNLLADGMSLFVRLLTLPIRFFFNCLKKIQKNFKKLFLYRKKWFKIKATFEIMDNVAREGAARKEGECHASDQSKYTD